MNERCPLSPLPALAFCQAVFSFTKPSRVFSVCRKRNVCRRCCGWSSGGWWGIREDRRQEDGAGREPSSGRGVERSRECLRESKCRRVLSGVEAGRKDLLEGGEAISGFSRSLRPLRMGKTEEVEP